MKETVLNKNDVPIVKCCASCAYKLYYGDATRFCKEREKKVKPNYKCELWKMSNTFVNLMPGGGGVKKKKYLQYMLNHPVRGGIDKIRYDYEKENGSIYLIKP